MTDTVSKTPRRAFTKHRHENQLQSYDEILDADSRDVPAYLRDQGESDVGPIQIPTRWYLDRQIHELEVERIWKRTWQMVCREDEVPEVGDTFVYEVAGLSFLVVRATPTSIKGYWNACLHRGATLRECPGRVDRIQCRFHGFTWGLDGRCQLVPFAEDFPRIDQENFSLPEVQVATWQGFVFLNPDPEAESLESYMGEAARQLERSGAYQNRQKVIHFSKVFPTNWKAAQEAFLDTFHVITTHPQFAIVYSDECTQFGTFGNWSRGILPFGQSSPYVPQTPTEQEIFERGNGVWDDDERIEDVILPEGKTARQAQTDRIRDGMRPVAGPLLDQWCDSEVVDIIWYTLFPNFTPFAGAISGGIVYRFLPYGNDPGQCVMDTMILMPVPPGAEPGSPADVYVVPDGEDFTSVPGLDGFAPFDFGAFLSQDIAVVGGMTRGLRNNQHRFVNLARKHDLKIRHFYAVYEKLLGLSAHDEVARLEAGAREHADTPAG